MNSPPVDPSRAAGSSPVSSSAGSPAGQDDRHPPSRSADPGQSSYGGFRGEDPAAQPHPPVRDDDELADALRERLEGFADVDASAVRIGVEHGRVTLSGEVADDAACRAVEARVAEVLGVAGVENRLRATRG